MDDTQVLFVIASQEFNEIEYSIPKKLITDAGFTVITASNRSDEAIAKDGSITHVDITLDKVIASNYLGIFFIGGAGAIEHLDNQTSYKIIQQALQHNLCIGAICIATRILANAHALTNKSATGWDGDDQLANIYKEHHVLYTKQPVVVDDNIITAIGPSAAEEFGKKIIEILQKKTKLGIKLCGGE